MVVDVCRGDGACDGQEGDDINYESPFFMREYTESCDVRNGNDEYVSKFSQCLER